MNATPGEVRNQLIPTLRNNAGGVGAPGEWVARLVAECRKGLATLLPLNDAEREFLDRLLDHGEIEPKLVTTDSELADRVRSHPGFEWKAQNVRQFKSGKS